MKVIFNNKEYKKSGRSGTALKNLCFDIFKYYLSLHNKLTYKDLQNTFNKWHCNNNFVVLTNDEWKEKTEDLKSRYFEPINYNNQELRFTTQWGNNGGNCDNINNMISFAKEQGYDIEVKDKIEGNEQDKKHDLHIKNIILYGAPGVGKTHNYQRLISMIEEEKNQNDIFDAISENEITNHDDNDVYQNIKDEKRVEFVTFHQSYSYEDFIEGFRPNEEGNIELEDGVFKNLSLNALNQIREVKDNHISFDEAFHILRTQYFDNEMENLYTVRNNEIAIKSFHEKSILVRTVDAKNWQYVKKNDLEIVVNGIKGNFVTKPADIKKLNVKKDTISLAGYYFPIANRILEIINYNVVEVTEQKNFYIVIDEINRGNISKIFGELITLIEEDKRDTYEVTLPYSKEKFKIPSNLYIIATMNSTDKSIATVDIALRRRFTFLKMQPKPELVADANANLLMQKLNNYIGKKLGDDYKLGHSYFMKIQNDEDLEFVIDYKIKPLLEEYFYTEEKSADDILQEALKEEIEEVDE
jgi:5-methylcytosine-specific restriction protein B